MTDHPITPPLELVSKWCYEDGEEIKSSPRWFVSVCAKAAQWGADQQLAKDAEWLDYNTLNEPHLRITPMGESLKEAMRPPPPSLKEQALESVKRFEKSGEFFSDQKRELEFIRKALETIND